MKKIMKLVFLFLCLGVLDNKEKFWNMVYKKHLEFLS